MEISRITKDEIRYVKKIFRGLEAAVTHINSKRNDFNEKEIKDYEWYVDFYIRQIQYEIAYMLEYEASYEIFEKYIDDEQYMEVFKKAWSQCEESYLKHKHENEIRLLGTPPGNEKKPRNNWKKCIKNLKSLRTFFLGYCFLKKYLIRQKHSYMLLEIG